MAKRPKIRSINENIICNLCKGYFIGATTIIKCMHSFCRACILQKWKNRCPTCNEEIADHEMSSMLKYDRTLQTIVYKLIPNLYEKEIQFQNNFKKVNNSNLPFIVDDSILAESNVISFKTQLVELHQDKLIKCKLKYFFQCEAKMKIYCLNKLLRSKLNLFDNHLIIFHYKNEIIPEEYSLLDIAFIYKWKKKIPLKINFSIYNILQNKQEITLDDSNGVNFCNGVELSVNNYNNNTKKISNKRKRSTNEILCTKKRNLNTLSNSVNGNLDSLIMSNSQSNIETNKQIFSETSINNDIYSNFKAENVNKCCDAKNLFEFDSTKNMESNLSKMFHQESICKQLLDSVSIQQFNSNNIYGVNPVLPSNNMRLNNKMKLATNQTFSSNEFVEVNGNKNFNLNKLCIYPNNHEAKDAQDICQKRILHLKNIVEDLYQKLYLPVTQNLGHMNACILNSSFPDNPLENLSTNSLFINCNPLINFSTTSFVPNDNPLANLSTNSLFTHGNSLANLGTNSLFTNGRFSDCVNNLSFENSGLFQNSCVDKNLEGTNEESPSSSSLVFNVDEKVDSIMDRPVFSPMPEHEEIFNELNVFSAKANVINFNNSNKSNLNTLIKNQFDDDIKQSFTNKKHYYEAPRSGAFVDPQVEIFYSVAGSMPFILNNKMNNGDHKEYEFDCINNTRNSVNNSVLVENNCNHNSDESVNESHNKEKINLLNTTVIPDASENLTDCIKKIEKSTDCGFKQKIYTNGKFNPVSQNQNILNNKHKYNDSANSSSSMLNQVTNEYSKHYNFVNNIMDKSNLEIIIDASAPYTNTIELCKISGYEDINNSDCLDSTKLIIKYNEKDLNHLNCDKFKSSETNKNNMDNSEDDLDDEIFLEIDETSKDNQINKEHCIDESIDTNITKSVIFNVDVGNKNIIYPLKNDERINENFTVNKILDSDDNINNLSDINLTIEQLKSDKLLVSIRPL